MTAELDSTEAIDQSWRQKPLRAVSIPGVLTPDECELVKRDALATGLSKPRTTPGQGRNSATKRTCEEVQLPHTLQREWLYETLLDKTAAVNEENWRFAVTGIEDLHVIRYRSWQRFSWHFDSHIGSPRKLTCVVSLSLPNTHWRGGLQVKGRHEGRKVAPLLGSGTWFPAYLEHRAKAPWLGERWVLVALLTGPAWV